jgi:hypothetical protein
LLKHEQLLSLLKINKKIESGTAKSTMESLPQRLGNALGSFAIHGEHERSKFVAVVVTDNANPSDRRLPSANWNCPSIRKQFRTQNPWK